MKLIIQIPCYNEENTLPEVVADLPRELPGIDTIEYLVIDDGSSDNTIAVARKLGIHHILRLGTNRGLARAFMAGIHRSLELGADIIVNTDGDNQYRASGIADLIAPILLGSADIVVGARPINQIKHFSRLKKCLQNLGSRVVRQFSGTDIPDTTSGFRAYSSEAAMKLHIFNRYTYTLETIIQAGHMGMRISHVPVEVNPKTRESRLISSMPLYIWRSVGIILRSYITYRPLRTFFYTAIIPGLMGVALMIRWLYLGARGHVPSLIVASVLLTASFLLLVLGVLADLISANRRLIQESLFAMHRQLYKQSEQSSPDSPDTPGKTR